MEHESRLGDNVTPIERRFIVPGLATGHATFHWIVQSFAVALPEIQDSTGLNSVGVAGVMSAMDLTAGQFALPSGLVVDVLRCYWELLLGLFASAAVVLAFLPTTRLLHARRRQRADGISIRSSVPNFEVAGIGSAHGAAPLGAPPFLLLSSPSYLTASPLFPQEADQCQHSPLDPSS